jgi:ACS family glucarate transporter-like MFS transporter
MTPSETKRLETGVPIRYALVLWLTVITAAAYLDRTNISLAGIEICKEFAITNVRLGWISSAFLIGYAGFQVPAGLLARRLGPRRSLALLGAWWAFFISLTALIPHGIVDALLVLLGVRFALGAGEATMFPATSQFVERWFPVQERGKANGLIFAGVGLSGLTPPLVKEIILRYGWRASFGFSACLCAAVGLVWYLASRDTPEQHPWVGDAERALILRERRVTEAAADDDAASYGKHKIPWGKIFRSKAVLAITASYFSFGYVAWLFISWFYIYMAQVRGVNLKTSAVYTMLPFLAMTVGCLGGGVVSDWIVARRGLRQGRCLLPGIALALTALLLVLGSRVESAALAAVVLACGAGVLYVAQSGYWAVTADIGGEYVGVVSGIMNMGGQIGGACTASLTPLIAAHFGWEMSFVVAAALAGMGALMWLLIDPRKPISVEPYAAV